MRYRIQWCDVTEYETEIEASSPEEAQKKFDSGEHSGYNPTGWVQMEEDSLSIEEITEEKMDYILWDCETQTELFRGTLEECTDENIVGVFGGGNYNVYPCPEHYEILTVISRDPNGEDRLKIILGEKK